MEVPNDSAQEILNTALRLADKYSWESLRLHHIADDMDIPLTAIKKHFQQKDGLVEAWYDRADVRMLKVSEETEFLTLNKTGRLHRLIMAWLDSLSEYKIVSRDMLLYKLEPAHIHMQILGILRISRTVQWFLEAAQSKTTHLHRILEETKLTAIYLATFSYWMFDKSIDQRASRQFLRNSLNKL